MHEAESFDNAFQQPKNEKKRNHLVDDDGTKVT